MLQKFKRKCAYCGSRAHTIDKCNLDTEMIDYTMAMSNELPDFSRFSTRMLKRMAVHYGYMSSMPRKAHVECLTQAWNLLQVERTQLVEENAHQVAASNEKKLEEDCPICFIAIGDNNTATTRCGHRFCLECMVTHARKSNECPLCRGNITASREVIGPSQLPTPIHRRYMDMSTDFANRMDAYVSSQDTLIDDIQRDLDQWSAQPDDIDILRQETQPEDIDILRQETQPEEILTDEEPSIIMGNVQTLQEVSGLVVYSNYNDETIQFYESNISPSRVHWESTYSSHESAPVIHPPTPRMHQQSALYQAMDIETENTENPPFSYQTPERYLA